MPDKTNGILAKLAVEIIDKSSSGFLVINDKGHVVYANPALKRMHGFDPEETVTQEKTLETLFPDPDKRRENIAIWQKDIALENPPPREFSMTTKKGEERWYRFTLSHMANGYQVVSVHDITDRKETEETLKENEQYFRRIIEQAPISMAIVSMNGVIECINRKAIETFGYLPEDIPTMAQWWVQAYPDKKYREYVVATWTDLVKKAIIEKHEIKGGEYRATCKDGSIKTVFIFGVPVANKIFVMFDDISMRKKAEEALKESEEMFRNLADQSPNMIFINHDRMVVYANKLCEKTMGYTHEEICSPKFNFMCLIAPEYHSVTQKAWECHTKGIEAPIYEYELVTKQGKRIPAIIATKLINYHNHRAVLGIVTDISELKHIHHELNKSAVILKEQKKALQEKNMALKEILAQIETEKLQFKKQVSINIEKLLLPALKKMRKKTTSLDKRYIDILELNIKELVSTFGLKLSSVPTKLSPREMEICNMIKSGLASKEISELLHVSLRTVETHRNRIRKKLRISTRDINLTSHLQDLT